jgi:hypothetical protein
MLHNHMHVTVAGVDICIVLNCPGSRCCAKTRFEYEQQEQDQAHGVCVS